MQKEVFVFDNDDTLYDCPKSFEKAITDKMIARIAELCSCSLEEIQAKRLELFKRYNIRYTLLVFHREGIIKDVERFIKETYLSVDPRDYGIKSNPQLRKMLKDLEAALYLHTNNPSAFAKKILNVLDVEDLFIKIYGMYENDCYQKPDTRAFQNLLKSVSNCQIKRYIDNEIPNLITAKQLGFKTILVAKKPALRKFEVDKQIANILDLTR
jgi:putative hydrolase of the HAD superfamily